MPAPLALGTLLGGSFLQGIMKNGTLGDILSGIFGGGNRSQPQAPPIVNIDPSRFVSGGVQVGKGIDPKLIFYGVIAVVITVIIGIFATRK
jgi:hypothetical protein